MIGFALTKFVIYQRRPRWLLEMLAVQLSSARGSTSHWWPMDELLATAVRVGDDDRAALLEIDHGCHAIFWAAADNKFLHESLAVLYAWSLRLWNYALPTVINLRQAVLEHQQMLAVARRGEGEQAAQMMQEHIHGFQRTMQTAILSKLGQAGVASLETEMLS